MRKIERIKKFSFFKRICYNDEDLNLNSGLAAAKLNKLINAFWLKYCEIVKRRFEVEVII